MQAPLDSPMIPLVEKWAAHFGYYDDKIDLSVDEFDSFTTPDCTLTAHAPLWRTKPGEERAIRVAEVRAQLAKMQRMSRVTRHDMHLALHPESDALALFFRVEGRLAFVPFTMMKVPLVFIVQAVETETGLRISEIHERRAANIQAARDAVVDHHGWPKDTVFEPYDGFSGV